MPVVADFPFVRYDDGILTISLAPPVAIGAWNIRLDVLKRFGGVSGIFTRVCASGFGGGQSGITIVSSGQGIFNADLRSVHTSGTEYGNLAYVAERLDSGSRTVLSEGYLLLTPGGRA